MAQRTTKSNARSRRSKRASAKAPRGKRRTPAHGGGALLTGNPGNKGGTGRPPDAWKEKCRELASREDVLAQAEAILLDTEHPDWFNVWRFVTEQGYGKAAQPVEASGNIGMTVRFE